MPAKAIRIDAVTYDGRRQAYRAQVTVAGQSGPELRTVVTQGHPTWGPSQIIRALKNRAAA